MFNKKGDAGLTAIIIILIALIFLGWLVNIGNRECKSNRECGGDYYCGADFRCHEYPNIQRTVTQVDYTRPALIIGIAIIIAALIFKFFNNRKEDKRESIGATSAEENKETDKKAESKEKGEDHTVYSNYPTYSHQYSVKGGKKKTGKKEIKGSENTYRNLFFNNYIGMILGGLTALGIILATSLDYLGIAIFGAVVLFGVVYKLWSYSLEYNAEFYLIAILSLIYIAFSLIYFLKSGVFILIGFGFLVITVFIIKETIAWREYKVLE